LYKNIAQQHNLYQLNILQYCLMIFKYLLVYKVCGGVKPEGMREIGSLAADDRL
jgi:hypothetical protein